MSSDEFSAIWTSWNWEYRPKRSALSAQHGPEISTRPTQSGDSFDEVPKSEIDVDRGDITAFCPTTGRDEHRISPNAAAAWYVFWGG